MRRNCYVKSKGTIQSLVVAASVTWGEGVGLQIINSCNKYLLSVSHEVVWINPGGVQDELSSQHIFLNLNKYFRGSVSKKRFPSCISSPLLYR